MKTSPFSNVAVGADETVDPFLDGRLHLVQPREGYRFSIDAVLLSEFVTTRLGDTAVDLGTGCGVIPLILLLTRDIAYALGIEIQAKLLDQARRNVVLNGFAGRMGLLHGDVRCLPLKAKSADLVLCNPPFRKKDSGRINPDQQRAIARHEILLSLDDILAAAAYLLRPKGRFAIVYPAERLVEILVRMRRFGLEAKRAQIVYPSARAESKRVLLEATSGGREGLKILAPLFDQGEFTVKKDCLGRD